MKHTVIDVLGSIEWHLARRQVWFVAAGSDDGAQGQSQGCDWQSNRHEVYLVSKYEELRAMNSAS